MHLELPLSSLRFSIAGHNESILLQAGGRRGQLAPSSIGPFPDEAHSVVSVDVAAATTAQVAPETKDVAAAPTPQQRWDGLRCKTCMRLHRKVPSAIARRAVQARRRRSINKGCRQMLTSLRSCTSIPTTWDLPSSVCWGL